MLSLVAAAAAGGCTDIPSGPDAVFSLGLERPPFPAVVVGDTLRNEAGEVVRITANAYSAGGEPIPGADVQYFSDPGITVSPDGIVVAGPALIPVARVFATIGGLTTQPESLSVVAEPLLLELVEPAPDSLPYTEAAPVSGPVATTLTGEAVVTPGSEPEEVAVPRWFVRYAVEFRGSTLADTNSIFSVVVPGGGPLSPIDTTDTNGRTERAVALLDPSAVAPGDVAVLLITAFHRGVPVGGEPLRVVLRVAPPGPSAPAPPADPPTP